MEEDKFATLGDLSTLRAKNMNAERDETAAAITKRPATDLSMGKYRLSHLLYLLQERIEESFGLAFMLFLYVNLLSQLAVRYDDVAKKLKILWKDIDMLGNKLISFGIWSENTDLALDDICRFFGPFQAMLWSSLPES